MSVLCLFVPFRHQCDLSYLFLSKTHLSGHISCPVQPSIIETKEKGRKKWVAVLLCFCCYNKLPQTGYFINKRNLFLLFWRLENQNALPADLLSAEGCSLLPRWSLVAALSRGQYCVLTWQKDRRTHHLHKSSLKPSPFMRLDDLS